MVYSPTYVKGYETGLVESRQNFILPSDAYPVLENAYVWRERILRKSGYRLLGRLRRKFNAQSAGMFSLVIGNNTLNIFTQLSITGEPNASIEPGNITPISIFFGIGIAQTLTDILGNGVLTVVGAGPITSASINYATGIVTIVSSAIAGPSNVSLTLAYFPNLPVMGARKRDLTNINNEQTIFFDTKYAYVFIAGFDEFIPGTTWNGTDSDFFWTTNYWIGDSNLKIFWETNFNKITGGGDPIRYTNGIAWEDFAPPIDAGGNLLNQCLAILPFRSRLMVFNTWEGTTLAGSVQMRQRIRWAQIGNPFYRNDTTINTINFNVDAWRDDIPGKGGFLDIPTTEDIVSVGFVRDNLVIYCESSTWQLRYTGRSIAPFQIEKVNTELGAESTFSAVQFDTSLVGIGDKGVVECDSYKSDRIDIKIPDLVFRFNNLNDGIKRVYGIRDFQMRLAYWTYVDAISNTQPDIIFPNRRLVYNYENDSWAIFKDSFTCFGTFQDQSSLRWIDFPGPLPDDTWESQDTPWNNLPAQFPELVGGNQQGFIEFLGQENFKSQNTNDISLYIKNIIGNTTLATTLQIPNHNLTNDDVIMVSGIPSTTPFSNLNLQIFGVIRIDANNVSIYKYSDNSKIFDDPQLDPPGIYIGAGVVLIRDNFIIQSKKFNFLDEGNTIQFGFMDILMENTQNGAITMNVYIDYNDSEPQNRYPQNVNELTNDNDPFFNSIIPTNVPVQKGSSKNWQRIYCNTRGSFITLEFTFSNAQLNGDEQTTSVQIDAQILYMRKAGRQLAIGV